MSDALVAVGRDWFARDSVELAPLLLGAVLVHDTEEGRVAIRLSEVEAYRGVGEDPGSHAFRGKTRRNAVMFGEAAHLYAYFTYGMHTCLNVVAGHPGSSSAVLLRGGTVIEGIELARLRYGARIGRGEARGHSAPQFREVLYLGGARDAVAVEIEQIFIAKSATSGLELERLQRALPQQ